MLHNISLVRDNLLWKVALHRLGHCILERQGGEECGSCARMDQKESLVLECVVVEFILCRVFYHLMSLAIESQTVDLIIPYRTILWRQLEL